MRAFDDQAVAGKRRTLCNESGITIAAATPTAYPTFPSGPDSSGIVLYAGDMAGSRVIAATLSVSDLTGYTALDATLQTSADGTTWRTLKAFAQVTAAAQVKELEFLDTDPKALRFFRLLVTMTGSPGTTAFTCYLHYDQVGARGAYAPPGMIDRS